MFSFMMAFLCGDLYLQTFSQLPEVKMIIFIVMINIIIFFCIKKYTRCYYLPAAFLLGFLWSHWYAASILSWVLPKEWEGRPIWVTGYVDSLPVTDRWQTSFFFSLESMQYGHVKVNKKSLIRLAWRDKNQLIQVGSKWKLLVRLKRIHGTQNPGTFDFEAWSLQKGLRATGYVLSHKNNQLISHHWYRYPIAQFRQLLYEKIKMHLPASNTSPWLMALIIGERNGISQEDWQVLRNTGTNHLMAIAGLHIGIMAGFTHFIICWLWRRSARLTLWFPAQQAGACAALMMALFYSMLAGFSIPTQRACMMLAVFIVTLLLRRKINAWQSWSLALFFVLMLNPLSVLTESFWLSFGTIALIIYGMSSRLAPSGWWWKWFRVQWVIGLGLIPITLSLFQQCSLVSFAANSIAIPWLGFFILPFCFLSSIFLFVAPSLGELFLFLADKSLAGLWVLLTWFSQLNFSSWYLVIPNNLILATTVLAFLFLLFPAGFPGRWIGLCWLLPLLSYQPSKPQAGEFWMTLLDVGQGLAVVVQTKHHLLVYDAGPKFNTHFDMGESVVLPYLHTIDAKKIDTLVVSHGDNDHIGGTQALIHALPIMTVKTSVPEKMISSSLPVMRVAYCFAGESWRWDQVNFSFLYPTPDMLHLGNDSSCVLRIDNGVHRVLLTGDIEKNAETELVTRVPEWLGSEILIAPHHGSKTSGVEKFIALVHPRTVLYATGYRNRYHFPHASIVAAYNKISAEAFNTTETGAILFKITKNKSIPVEQYRQISKRYWRE